MLTKLLVGAAVNSKKRRKRKKNNLNVWNRNFWVTTCRLTYTLFHSSISAFGFTLDEPGAQGSHFFKPKTSRSHFSLSENLNDCIYMLTAQWASELHPGLRSLQVFGSYVHLSLSHAAAAAVLCTECFQTCALNSALFKFNSTSDEQLKFRRKNKK